MTSDEAIAARRRMHESLDVETLYMDVLERMAIRDVGPEWSVVKQGNDAVRIFRKLPDGRQVSRYVWHWRKVDEVIECLLNASPEALAPRCG